jgi:hypothetical protein
VVFPVQSDIKVGDYVKIKIIKATSATLFGDFVEHYSIEKENILNCL